jgi:glucose uptake protein
MFVPEVYAVALAMMIASMLCWGSWANTQKAAKNWRFELFYWDYVWGILIIAMVLGVTLGRTDATSPDSFFRHLASADARNIVYALVGGIVFNVGNLLLVAAIETAGLAVAFPIGIGLALVIGAVLNYLVTPNGNPLLLFGGIALVCLAIVFDALAYRKISLDTQITKKGIVLSVLSGLGIGLFYPLIAKAIKDGNHLGPYTVFFVFAIGILICTVPVNYGLMRRPISGSPVAISDYWAGAGKLHLWGILGGLIWGVGTNFNFVASYAPIVGPAASYALGQGATMISALWGVFVWKEFRGAGPAVKRYLALMFILFIAGLTSIALAPVLQ